MPTNENKKLKELVYSNALNDFNINEQCDVPSVPKTWKSFEQYKDLFLEIKNHIFNLKFLKNIDDVLIPESNNWYHLANLKFSALNIKDHKGRKY